jgi:2-polyprenyl-6-hydroxyphenyl methylase / 3-demethylubiquinone-9 3-methyltransferase
MPANNQIYDQQAAGWWDENHFLHMLKTGLNPARFGYFRQVLTQLGREPQQLRGLEIGCGGGLLTEEFARLGFQMTGIDQSAASILVARSHARQENLAITYLVGNGEKLPFAAASFDLVICCDVLEHVLNVDKVLSEAARILRNPDPALGKSGGLFCYDTLNRTLQSYFETIFIGQICPLTSFFAPQTHNWQQFIRPNELLASLKQNGLENQGLTGLVPGCAAPLTAFYLVLRKLGRLSFAELGRKLKFIHRNGQTGGSYAGYAIKKHIQS